MTIVFQNSSRKITNKAFLFPYFGFYFLFREILQLHKFVGADFKCDKSVLKF